MSFAYDSNKFSAGVKPVLVDCQMLPKRIKSIYLTNLPAYFSVYDLVSRFPDPVAPAPVYININSPTVKSILIFFIKYIKWIS